jgi:hypothetical protein
MGIQREVELGRHVRRRNSQKEQCRRTQPAGPGHAWTRTQQQALATTGFCGVRLLGIMETATDARCSCEQEEKMKALGA